MDNLNKYCGGQMLLVVSEEQLKSIVGEAVSSALAAREENKKQTLLTRKKVSERLNVDNSTLWRWDKSNYLKAIKVGKAVMYREEDVIAIEEGRV